MAKCKWNPPPAGSKKRKEMPKSAFLQPEKRLYPFKEKKDGEWKVSECGLMAAYRRSILQGTPSVTAKAKKKLNPIRKKKGKEPIGKKKN